MRKTAIVFLVLLIALAAKLVAQDTEDVARRAAEQWIVLVDDGQYDESWKEASKLFQDSVTAEDWNKKASAARTELGHRESRSLKDLKAMPRPKGLPPGQYFLVKYQSSFANKHATAEIVTTVLEGDGVWRVAAYTIN